MKDIFNYVTIVDTSCGNILNNNIPINYGLGFKLYGLSPSDINNTDEYTRLEDFFRKMKEGALEYLQERINKLMTDKNQATFDYIKIVNDDRNCKEMLLNTKPYWLNMSFPPLIYMGNNQGPDLTDEINNIIQALEFDEIVKNLFAFYRLLQNDIVNYYTMTNPAYKNEISGLKKEMCRWFVAMKNCQKIGLSVNKGKIINVKVFGKVDKGRKGRWYNVPERAIHRIILEIGCQYKDETFEAEYTEGVTHDKLKALLYESMDKYLWIKGIKISNKNGELNEKIRNSANLKLLSKVNSLYRFIIENRNVNNLLIYNSEKKGSKNIIIIGEFVNTFLNITIPESILINSLNRKRGQKPVFYIN